MSLLSLFFERPKPLQINTTNEEGVERELLLLDVSQNIAHQNISTPTQHPVEEGVDISDHVDLKAKVLDFSGIVSEAPITLLQTALGTVSGALPAISGVSGGLLGTIFTGAISTLGGLLMNTGDRAQEGFNAMLEVHDKKIPVTLITGLRVYTNMILTKFAPIETDTNGRSLVFTATFTEILVVKSEQVVIPQRILDKSVRNKAASVQKKGKKTAGTPTDQVQKRGSSVLADITGLGA